LEGHDGKETGITERFANRPFQYSSTFGSPVEIPRAHLPKITLAEKKTDAQKSVGEFCAPSKFTLNPQRSTQHHE
jgi:hypothetical protein